jgi:hypothetical protein
MNFVNPWFWLGTLAAAVPILLHLIKRESAQKIEFPTLMFLRKIHKRTIRYQKLRHLLLLLVRIAILLLLTLAFMRPFQDRPQAAAATGRIASAHVILLDNSMSMAYGDRWDRARRAAADIVRRAESGDKVCLIEFSDQANVLTLPATDFAVVLDAVNKVAELSDRPTRYGQALKIAEKSALETDAGKRVIHLISDFQKSGWAAEERDFRLGAGVELRCTDVGSDEFSNLSLGDVQIIEGEEEAGGSLKIRFSAVNFGGEDRKAARVSLSSDEHVIAEKPVDIAKGDLQPVEFQLPGLTAGRHDVALEIADPGMKRDNRFCMTLEARSKIQVLSVENAQTGREGRPPSFFLANALNISVLSPYRLTAITPQQFGNWGALTGGLVVWNNVSGGSAAIQKKLQDFVKGGGGLVIALADNSQSADFNRTFGSWLPLKVEASAGTQKRNAEYAANFALLSDLRMDHPIFRPFSEPNSGSFATARIYRHASLSVSEGAQVLARFDNGDPALAAVEVEKGRVLILATSADDATNDLPLKAVYAPFWHQILRHLENSPQERRWMNVGDTISPKKLLVEAAIHQGKGNANLNEAIVVVDPAKKRIPIAPGTDMVAVDTAGFYGIHTASLNASVAVNPSLRESDLTHGNSEEMVAGWVSSEVKAPEAVSADERPTREEQDRRSRFWLYILLGVLALLLIESLLANRLALKPE